MVTTSLLNKRELELSKQKKGSAVLFRSEGIELEECRRQDEYDGRDCCFSTCISPDENACRLTSYNDISLIYTEYLNCTDPETLCEIRFHHAIQQRPKISHPLYTTSGMLLQWSIFDTTPDSLGDDIDPCAAAQMDSCTIKSTSLIYQNITVHLIIVLNQGLLLLLERVAASEEMLVEGETADDI